MSTLHEYKHDGGSRIDAATKKFIDDLAAVFKRRAFGFMGDGQVWEIAAYVAAAFDSKLAPQKNKVVEIHTTPEIPS